MKIAIKAISGIMVPTEGSVEVRGNIAALLGYTRGFLNRKYEERLATVKKMDLGLISDNRSTIYGRSCAA